MTSGWVDVCAVDAVDREDVTRFDHATRTFAVFRTRDDRWFATDGECTHGQAHLAEGYVEGTTIECPKHNGRFDLCTGRAKGTPVTQDLAVHPVRVEGGRVQLFVGSPSE